MDSKTSKKGGFVQLLMEENPAVCSSFQIVMLPFWLSVCRTLTVPTRSMAIPPLVIPPRASADGGQASQTTSNVASPREIISGDA